ncbi:hypothetical protein [Edaphobacter modestus]|uniref:hypothetical protein n=1 Tax=Edaphobacter modestus TaxID=388466 RepID=UPI0013EE52A2|nr:hypothetical protein [Edaphobacter modestus]
MTDHSIYAEYCGGLTPSCHLTHEAAQAARDQMAKGIEKLNEGRRDISSVLSEGRYGVEIHEDALPPFYPEHRPRYE